MRFLHTADWQIGMRAAHVGEAGARVRDERLAAARRAIEAARAAQVDFVLLAGDTFEDHGVDRAQVQKVVDVLAAFGGPVYVLPGNHDPLVPGSIWDLPVWKGAPDVRVLRDAAPVPVPGGELWPCPAFARSSSEDPTSHLHVARDEARGVRVVVAHGTVALAQVEEPEFPIALDAPARCAADYVAIGHWHSLGTYRDADGAVRMAYPGTHETTKFGERDSGNVLLVQIDAPGAAPVLTTVKTGGLTWTVLEQTVREAGDLARLRARVEAIQQAETTLVRVRLEGLLSTADQDELFRLGALVDSRFLFGRLEAHGLRPLPGDASWLMGLPAGLLREAAARLEALSDPDYTGERPEGGSAEVASWALMELYELVARGDGRGP